MAIISIQFQVPDSALAAMLSQASPVQEVRKAPKKTERKTDAAPWGFKKDGTPKKRPGRPAK